MSKILCGSNKLFERIKGFIGKDKDYVVFPTPDITYAHTHPYENVCYFMWGQDKEQVRKYIKQIPNYFLAMTITTKEFVDYYELSKEDVLFIINTYYNIFEQSTYRYYIPFFDYIREHYSWDFPDGVVYRAYKLYKKYKK